MIVLQCFDQALPQACGSYPLFRGMMRVIGRWGLKVAERGGRNGKKGAIVATAIKLAVLLHHVWRSGEVHEPLHNSSRMTVVPAA